MSRFFLLPSLLMLLVLASCSPQKDAGTSDDDEWAEIEAIAEAVVPERKTETNAVKAVRNLGEVALGDFDPHGADHLAPVYEKDGYILFEVVE